MILPPVSTSLPGRVRSRRYTTSSSPVSVQFCRTVMRVTFCGSSSVMVRHSSRSSSTPPIALLAQSVVCVLSTALDISSVALERGRRVAAQSGLTVEWLCADLDEDPERVLPAGPFALIVWARYVHRTLMPHLVARLDFRGALGDIGDHVSHVKGGDRPGHFLERSQFLKPHRSLRRKLRFDQGHGRGVVVPEQGEQRFTTAGQRVGGHRPAVTATTSPGSQSICQAMGRQQTTQSSTVV